MHGGEDASDTRSWIHGPGPTGGCEKDEEEGGENSDGLINQADPQGGKAATKAVVKVKVDKNKTAKKKSLKRL